MDERRLRQIERGDIVTYLLKPEACPTDPAQRWRGKVLSCKLNTLYFQVEILNPGHEGLPEWIDGRQIVQVEQHSPGSEVARLRAQIDLEFEAMQRGLHGVAAGTAKHQFIMAKMERAGRLTDELAGYVGEQEANTINAQAYMQAVEREP
jgi:hypothetical protein